MNRKISALNKNLILSALSPNRIDIVVTKQNSCGDNVNWVVMNRYNQEVFLLKRENFVTFLRLTLVINGVNTVAIVNKPLDAKTLSSGARFLLAIERLLKTKEQYQKSIQINRMLRNVMSTDNIVMYDYLVNTLQK